MAQGRGGELVTEPDGFEVHPDTLPRRWRALVKRAGVKSIPLHGARHSYATLALEAGVRLDIVSRQLGHASIAITADTYGHPDDKVRPEWRNPVQRESSGGSEQRSQRFRGLSLLRRPGIARQAHGGIFGGIESPRGRYGLGGFFVSTGSWRVGGGI